MITWAVFIAKVIILKNRASDSWVAEKKCGERKRKNTVCKLNKQTFHRSAHAQNHLQGPVT